jgi:hypothetical protein
MRLICLIILLLGALPVQAATIFSEDYEVTTLTDLKTKGWGVDCLSIPCTSDIWSMAGHTGAMTKAIRMTYSVIDCPSSGPVCDDSKMSNISRAFPGQDEIYERYWVLYKKINGPLQHVSNLNVSAKQHYFKSNSSNALSTVFGFNFSGGLRDSPGFTVQRNPAVTCPSGSMAWTCSYPPNRSIITMPFDQWVCVETHQKMNTVGMSNGVIEVWLNGTLTTQYTNVIYRNALISFNFIRVLRRGGENMYRYEDDFVLADTRVRCSDDTTPPTAPTNMIVR